MEEVKVLKQINKDQYLEIHQLKKFLEIDEYANKPKNKVNKPLMVSRCTQTLKPRETVAIDISVKRQETNKKGMKQILKTWLLKTIDACKETMFG